MSAVNPTRVYRATDSTGIFHTKSSSRPLAFCVVFTGGLGVAVWSNNRANAERAAVRKRQVARAPGILLTGCTVEILDTVETARTRTSPMTDSERQKRYRNRKGARAVAHRAALEAIIRLAQVIARKSLERRWQKTPEK